MIRKLAKSRDLIIYTLTTIVLCTLVGWSCSRDKDATTTVVVKEGVGDSIKSSADTSSVSGSWVYRTVKNNLTDVPTYYAECTSQSAKHILDDQQLDQQLTITLCRRKGRPDEVILSGNRGVFIIGGNTTKVRVRFDDGPVETFSCSVNEEYLSNGLLIDDASRFISRVREADSCRIGTSYLHNGELIFTHNLQGLKW